MSSTEQKVQKAKKIAAAIYDLSLDTASGSANQELDKATDAIYAYIKLIQD